MKHLDIIQKEFIKIAVSNNSRRWTKMNLEEQKAYLQEHPNSKKKLTGKPSKRKHYRVKPKFKKFKKPKNFEKVKTHRTVMLTS